MDHMTANARLSAYMDGELTAAERAAVEQHLAACSTCAATLRDLQLISQAVRGFPAPSVDAKLLQKLHKNVDQVGRRPVERFVGLLSGVAACLAVIGGLMLMQPANAAPVPPDRWEGHAVGIIDDNLVSTGSNTREMAIGQWMVSDLSTRGD
jgi:anti-sigma factor RsiW